MGRQHFDLLTKRVCVAIHVVYCIIRFIFVNIIRLTLKIFFFYRNS